MKNETNAINSDVIPPPQSVYEDIQGLLINGYRGYNFIRFLIYTIPQANIAAVRTLCGALLPGTVGSPLTITAATRLPLPVNPLSYKLNMGLTNTGLKKLIGDNYSQLLGSELTPEGQGFDGGAAAAAATVNDVNANAPKNWWQTAGWQLEGQDPTTTDLDILFSLYANSDEERSAWYGQLKDMIGDSATLAFMQDSDPLDPAGQQIHFGYRDGISQPRINGFSQTDPALDDRPVVDSWQFIINSIVEGDGPPTYNAHPFLTNGSFGAFRLLYQDVASFETFINQNGKDQAEMIASKMCGRWRDGTPIEVSTLKPENLHLLGQTLRNEFQLSNFNYLSSTKHQVPNPLGPVKTPPDTGQICPYAAHTRRSNPRDDSSVTTDMAAANRILRRARPYGLPYNPDLETSADQDRGLIGLFICADIGGQFEFVMQNWITGSGFSNTDGSANGGGYDPLFGDPTGNSTNFEYCEPGTDPTNSNNYVTLGKEVPQFIITKGGLYVFLPSITALGYLASGSLPSPSLDAEKDPEYENDV